MGGNMARRLMAGGHEVVAYDRNLDAVQGIAKDGVTGSSSLADRRPPHAAALGVAHGAAGDPTEQP
jgi:6-phosphogluconate dehydrogenase